MNEQDRKDLEAAAARAGLAARLRDNADFVAWRKAWEIKLEAHKDRLASQHLSNYEVALTRGIINQMKLMFGQIDQQALSLEVILKALKEEKTYAGNEPAIEFPDGDDPFASA